MKPKFLALTILAAAAFTMYGSPARAEKFECNFTEPFYALTYDTDSQKLVSTDLVMRKRTTYRNAKFQITAPGEFKVSDQRGRALLSLKLTMNGSDGMSPVIYAYEAETALIGGANNGVGGCESSLLKNRMGEP